MRAANAASGSLDLWAAQLSILLGDSLLRRKRHEIEQIEDDGGPKKKRQKRQHLSPLDLVIGYERYGEMNEEGEEEEEGFAKLPEENEAQVLYASAHETFRIQLGARHPTTMEATAREYDYFT
jgi:hypothetical protein